MCEYCGCDTESEVTATNLQTGRLVTLHSHSEDHIHSDGTRHSHQHGDVQHSHDHHVPATRELDLKARVLAKNDSHAASNRSWLAAQEILAVNLMSGPGSGKTTLLERTIRDLCNEASLYVLEGDQATSNDGERVRRAGAQVVQLNTGTGCHLDAHMVAHGLAELSPSAGSLVFVENIGNLVCPALFDLGEKRRVALFSTTEGEDKPLKYPHMFRGADLVLVSKIDLLPHLDFDIARAVANARAVNPGATILEVSARTGDGLDEWYGWLRRELIGVAAAERAHSRPVERTSL